MMLQRTKKVFVLHLIEYIWVLVDLLSSNNILTIKINSEKCKNHKKINKKYFITRKKYTQ